MMDTFLFTVGISKNISTESEEKAMAIFEEQVIKSGEYMN